MIKCLKCGSQEITHTTYDLAEQRAAPAMRRALVEILENAGFMGGEAETSLRELTVSIRVLRLARAAIEEAGLSD